MKKIIINKKKYEYEVSQDKDSISVLWNNKKYRFLKGLRTDGKVSLQDEYHVDKKVFLADSGHFYLNGKQGLLEKDSRKKRKGSSVDSGDMLSPMPGKIIKVEVRPQELVQQGQTLMIMEAMKMEHSIKSTVSGVVEKIYFKEGDSVDGGVELIVIKQKDGNTGHDE